MTPIEELEQRVLRKLRSGPHYVRTFGTYWKPIIDRLVMSKKIVRTHGPNNKARNMIALADEPFEKIV